MKFTYLAFLTMFFTCSYAQIDLSCVRLNVVGFEDTIQVESPEKAFFNLDINLSTCNRPVNIRVFQIRQNATCWSRTLFVTDSINITIPLRFLNNEPNANDYILVGLDTNSAINSNSFHLTYKFPIRFPDKVIKYPNGLTIDYAVYLNGSELDYTMFDLYTSSGVYVNVNRKGSEIEFTKNLNEFYICISTKKVYLKRTFNWDLLDPGDKIEIHIYPDYFNKLEKWNKKRGVIESYKVDQEFLKKHKEFSTVPDIEMNNSYQYGQDLVYYKVSGKNGTKLSRLSRCRL